MFCFVIRNHRLTRSSLIKKKIPDCRFHFFLKTIDTVTRYKLLRDVGICSKFSPRFLVMGNYTQI